MRIERVGSRQSCVLLAGAVLLALLWLGPLPAMARTAFSAHMILHLGVMAVAAPLIAIGLLPRILYHDRHPLRTALAVSVLDFAVVWGWHLPSMHEAAAANPAIFMAQQASFLLAGTILWLACLQGRDRWRDAIASFVMLFTAMHMAMLGVLLVLAPRLLHAPQYCLGAFGFDPLTDQQFGGGLMALFGALPFMIGGAWLAARAAHGEPDGTQSTSPANPIDFSR